MTFFHVRIRVFSGTEANQRELRSQRDPAGRVAVPKLHMPTICSANIGSRCLFPLY
jgi:hypothetical protein